MRWVVRRKVWVPVRVRLYIMEDSNVELPSASFFYPGVREGGPSLPTVN